MVKRGRGRPKGTKNKSTFDKELLREELRRLVRASLTPMTEAQIANAMGIKYLVVRQKSTGKFVRVTEAMARLAKLGEGEEAIEVWEKDPSVQAYTDLMNRTIDKPIEQVTADVTANVVYRWKAEE
jgi:hypothetical protein